MAVTRPDARYLLVANGTMLSVFDTHVVDKTQKSLLDIPLEGSVEGLGIAEDNSVYAFIPSSGRLFLFSPTGFASE
jgi:hypothetical protein